MLASARFRVFCRRINS